MVDMKYESPRIKFPSKVWRVRIEMRNGEWAIVKNVEIPSMTLPRHTPLPRSGEKRGVTGFWVEVLGTRGETLYRVLVPNPLERSVEVFEADGSIKREEEANKESCMFEVLIPDIPEMESLAVFSNITETGKQMAKAHQLARMPLDKLLGGGGEYGRG